MAKTTAPMLSFGGSGQLAKTMVYSKWKGVPYARQYVIPANPNSAGQQATRGVFKYASAIMKLAGSNLSAVWTAYASGKPLTQRNAFMQANIKALRSQDENTDMVFSSGANGGIAAAALASAVAAKVITITLTAPVLPDGWTIAQAVGIATLQQDPETYTDARTYEAVDATDAYAPAVTVPADGTYVIGGWFKYTKSNGSIAYGPALSATAVVAA